MPYKVAVENSAKSLPAPDVVISLMDVIAVVCDHKPASSTIKAPPFTALLFYITTSALKDLLAEPA